ncbi:MAG: hypothetical protein HN981_00575, partial [Candidatus Pacebacteria bacterium]|nr:hypothetical protein [Candidatus Paceibacterota bacterium]
ELKNWKKNNYAIKFLFNGFLSLGITAFYWLPFIFEKKYIVIDGHNIINNFSNRFLPVKQLLFSRWGHGGADISIPNDVFPATLGLSILVILFYSLIKLIKFLKKENSIKKYKDVIFWLVVFFLSVFLMLPISKKVWNFSKVLPYLQYPWRLLWVSTFSGIMILNSWKKINKFILYIILVIVLHHSIFYTNPVGYISNSNHDWLEYFGTSTSDNELKAKWFDEHKNIGITEKIVLNPPSSNQKIDISSWNGSEMVYEIETDSSTNVLQKTMYFPGWEAVVDGEKVDINYMNEEFPGRINFSLEKGKHNIKVNFTNNTPARKTGLYLTLVSIITYIVVILFSLFKTIKNNKNQ